jgi:hypothetical protein
MLGLFDIGYKGYAGFELCHPLPVVNGQTVGLEFVAGSVTLIATPCWTLASQAA